VSLDNSKTAADQADAELAARIVDAIKEVDSATATRNEKAVAAGKLLVEARKRHPTKKAFVKFLQLAGGVQIRRAQELIAFALGRKDFEQHRIENAAAQQRRRDKLKAEKIEREKAKAALPKPEPKPKSEGKGKGDPEVKPAEPKPALRNAPIEEDAATSAERRKAEYAQTPEKKSEKALAEFRVACDIYLPQMSVAAHRDEAIEYAAKKIGHRYVQTKAA
jgi:hypothetical protein